MSIFTKKEYKYKVGDVLKEKITHWDVVLLGKRWRIDGGGWDTKVWVQGANNSGSWKYTSHKEEELFHSNEQSTPLAGE